MGLKFKFKKISLTKHSISSQYLYHWIPQLNIYHGSTMSSALYKTISFHGGGETAKEAPKHKEDRPDIYKHEERKGAPQVLWSEQVSPKCWEIRGPQSHIIIRPNNAEGGPSVETTISEHVCEPLAGCCTSVHPWMEALRPTFPCSPRDSLLPAPLTVLYPRSLG